MFEINIETACLICKNNTTFLIQTITNTMSTSVFSTPKHEKGTKEMSSVVS